MMNVQFVQRAHLDIHSGKSAASLCVYKGEEHVAMARAHRRKFAGVPEDFTFEFITTKVRCTC